MTIYAILQGNVGKDPVKRNAGSSELASFSVASSYREKNERKTTWVNCTVWGKQADVIMQYVKKGSRLLVSGELTTREHDGKTYLELNVQGFELLGGKDTVSHDAPMADNDPIESDSIPF
jgi:single-strand DNA-binding protein